VGEVLGSEILPMLNAMSQGRSGSMCTIHADSSAGVFRRIASYAVQAQERLPLEATNLLIAGSIHFVVHLDSDIGEDSSDCAGTSENQFLPTGGSERTSLEACWAGRVRHRFVSSIREVVDAEDAHVVSNEIYRPGPDRRAVSGSPLRRSTLDDLERFGYRAHASSWMGMPA
jgi:pilus assembly protein CpaF